MSILTKYSQRGMSLVEVAVVLVIIGAVTAFTMSGGSNMATTQSRIATDTQLEIIQKALFAFYDINKRLPCAATLNTPIGAANFGMEATNCTGGTAVRIGAVPVRTLGMSDGLIADSYGDRFTYAVVEGLTNAATFGSTAATIRVNDASGNAIRTDVAFFVFSHGPDGKGATSHSSLTVQTACGASANLDVENCNGGTVFREAPFNNGSVANRFYDDFSRWSTKPMLQKGQLQVQCNASNVNLQRFDPAVLTNGLGTYQRCDGTSWVNMPNCPTAVTWTVGANSCTANVVATNAQRRPGSTTVFTSTTPTGTATMRCGDTGAWIAETTPAATCGGGLCTTKIQDGFNSGGNATNCCSGYHDSGNICRTAGYAAKWFPNGTFVTGCAYRSDCVSSTGTNLPEGAFVNTVMADFNASCGEDYGPSPTWGWGVPGSYSTSNVPQATSSRCQSGRAICYNNTQGGCGQLIFTGYCVCDGSSCLADNQASGGNAAYCCNGDPDGNGVCGYQCASNAGDYCEWYHSNQLWSCTPGDPCAPPGCTLWAPSTYDWYFCPPADPSPQPGSIQCDGSCS